MVCEFEKKWTQICPSDDGPSVLSQEQFQEQIDELENINQTLKVLGWVLGYVDRGEITC